MPTIVAPVWEALARQHLLAASGRGQIPFPVQEVGSWWTRGAQTCPERSRRIDVVGVNRADHRVVFGEARWTKIPARGRNTPVTTADLHALMEKGLLWLKGDTARWNAHYAFFARTLGQVEEAGLGEENIHVFTPDDVTRVNA